MLQLLTPTENLWKSVDDDGPNPQTRFDANLHALLLKIQASKWSPTALHQYTERYIQHHAQNVIPESRFPRNDMHDAHEFVMVILDHVGSNDRVFRGTQCRTTVCDRGHESTRTDHFYQLHVENVQHDGTLQEFIAAQYSEEALDGENMFYCDTCQGKRSATTVRDITEWPEYLLIQVGRFAPTGHKLHDPFEFPTLWSGRGGHGTVKYKLVTAVMHQGLSTNAGHYTAFGRIPAPGADEWMFYNDTVFTRVSRDVVQSQKSYRSVYLLLYHMIH